MRQITISLAALCFAISGFASAQVTSKPPTTASEFYGRGLVRAESKQFKEAIEDCKKAVELNPGFFDAHFTLSSLYAAQKDYKAANDALASSLKARPKDYSASFNSGLYHEYLRDFDSAIAHYTDAIADDADFSHYAGSTEEARAHAYHYRGRVYQWHKKDHAKAIADFTVAIDLNPQIEMVHYRRACAYQDMKDYAKANADFAAASKFDPECPNLSNAWAWQLATCPVAKYRDGQLAIQLAKKSKDPATLAAAYAEAGEFTAAIAAQKQAIEQLKRTPGRSDKLPENGRIQEMQARLAAYQAKRPYREEQ